jgi:hypothetical protein
MMPRSVSSLAEGKNFGKKIRKKRPVIQKEKHENRNQNHGGHRMHQGAEGRTQTGPRIFQ